MLIFGGLIIKTPTAFADVNDFYFDEFEADYYLSKDEVSGSKLKVVEKLTAVFPDYEQNKGICRYIPFTNQGGTNVTLKNLEEKDIKLTRNGAPEPIYSIERADKFFNVCTGTDDYVTGRQVYTFEYEFKKTITEFTDEDKSWQELYWDTNGTGWRQRFNRLTARVHFEDPAVWANKAWCYVGRYGESGQNRCTIEPFEGGVAFKTEGLAVGENLTFDLELKANSFAIPDPEPSYMMFVLTSITFLTAIVSVIKPIQNFFKATEKRRFYKGYFVKPEYQPHKNYSLATLHDIYMGRKKDVKVALLLKMLVEKKIAIRKSDKTLFGKQKWSLDVKNLDDLSEEEKIILRILNGGDTVGVGDTINLKRHEATSRLVNLGHRFTQIGTEQAKAQGLVEPKADKFDSALILPMLLLFALGLSYFFFFAQYTSPIAYTDLGAINSFGEAIVSYRPLKYAIFAIIIMATLVVVFCSRKSAPYFYRTKEGLEASRYMDGLKLYIKMAEADRLKFLHSVDGADTSNTGVVKLYEKLLPFAALFGLETSWLKAIGEYYQLEEVKTPDWYDMNGVIAASQVASVFHSASRYAALSSSFSSSSFSSGGGGGGFSGGGGGGGGGGGR